MSGTWGIAITQIWAYAASIQVGSQYQHLFRPSDLSFVRILGFVRCLHLEIFSPFADSESTKIQTPPRYSFMGSD
ncbi:hypothetical protein AAHA92_22781 [Salvia divinorum]|uniref:Uncharacterized protein n=1 Tax=Salvia divinorum TaxID=28513 RepID=A0ABD1GSM9_SALDI